jgi:hypothetical protein
MGSLHEQLSEQFYQWEQRGRGWQVFPQPVTPEPPFRSFNGYRQSTPPVDDTRRSSAFSSLLQKLSRSLSTEAAVPSAVPESIEEPEPEILIRDSLVELQTSLPAKLDISKDTFEQFLSSVSFCHEPLTFELLGTARNITAQFVSHQDDAPSVQQQLEAFFPEATFQAQAGTLENAWNESQGDHVLVVEFGLEHEFMLPLASGKLDPFVGIVGVLAKLQEGELALFQVLFQPTTHPWSESIIHSVTHSDGKPFFVNSPELAKAAETKTTKPLYAAVVRIMVCSGQSARTRQLACDLAGSLRVFAHPHGNELIPLSNDEYGFEEHIEDVLLRQSRRSGMLLNSDELFGFVHLPSSAVRSPALKRDSGKTKAAPSIARQSEGVLIGDNVHAGKTVPIRLTTDQRVRHTHIIGASGTGKSTLLFNLISQDIQNGDGIGVLDPHGDLIDRILGIIPESRINDVVLVDLADSDFPVGFNILSAHTDLEKDLLASDLVSIFRRFSSSWGDQMDTVLQNSILPFLEGRAGGTLGDLRRFLIEPAFRNDYLKTVRNPETLYYWQKVFPQLTGSKSVGPLLTRLQNFFSRGPIRNMVLQAENRLDFADIMDSGKIFLARLPEGQSGAENTYLLGALLMSKFQQTAMSRQAQAIAQRRDFWLYIDEFDHFISPSMAEILKGSRKYRLGLTLAHQELHQLQSDPKVASAVATHPCTRIVFRVGDDDARKLGESFSFFDAQSLKNLETFQAIARVERADFDFNLQVHPLSASDDRQAEMTRQAVIAASRARYATPHIQVEEVLLANLNFDQPKVEPPAVHQPVAKAPEVRKVEEKPAPVPAPVSEEESLAEDESQHQALKNKLGIEAEGLDYTVSFEENVPPGKGRIDLVVRRGKKIVACEVSVKSPVRYEVENIHKCLTGGFAEVALISANRRKLDHIRELFTETATTEQLSRVSFVTPDEFIAKLYQWADSDPQGAEAERGKPKKQKISLLSNLLSNAERQAQEQEWLQQIKAAMKKKSPQ